MDQYIGKMLDDRYEILDVIGVGGMAVVYKALCHRLHRYVAVKILKDEFLRDDELRSQFEAESRAVAMLSHPNIVNVYDVSHSDGVDYIVMELIDGISLKQYLQQKGRLDWREVLHFSTQIAKALQHAHNRGVIHRDIKPHNIMLLKDGSLKVADFGIAQLVSAKSKASDEVIGSVHYVSPELARGESVDARSDLYSLGIVMYEMLTGEVPYDGDQPSDVARMHLIGGAVPPHEKVSGIPSGLEQITLRAMCGDLTQRYGTATQILDDLEAFRKDPTVSFMQKSVGTGRGRRSAGRKAERKRRKFGILAVFIAGVIIAAVVVGFGWILNYLMADMFTREEDVKVPNLYLTSLELAQSKYADVFQIVDEDWVYDDRVAKGLILSQNPKAEKTVKPGAVISVTVSLGTEQLIMPDIAGKNLSEATAAISGFDLELQIHYEDGAVHGFKDGQVIRSDPVFGSVLMPKQKVDLYVSRSDNGDYIPMPDIVGLNITAAKLAIEKLGLECAPLYYSVSKEAVGTVIKQSIPAEERVAPGTLVRLEVSSGDKEKAQEPNILTQPISYNVLVGEAVSLKTAASVEDGGTLIYEWLTSQNGPDGVLTPVASTQSLDITTAVAGTYYYCCRITNVAGEENTAVLTDMVTITVKDLPQKTAKVFNIPLPDQGNAFEVEIYLDGAPYSSPFVVTAPTDPTVPRLAQVAVEALGMHQIRILLNGSQVWESVEVFS